MVKNLAVTGLVSTNILEPIVDQVFDWGMEKLVDDTSFSLEGKHIIFINGDWLECVKILSHLSWS